MTGADVTKEVVEEIRREIARLSARLAELEHRMKDDGK